MYSQHFRDVLNSGKGDGTFFIIIVMFNNLENQIFQYNGSPITFQKGNSVMVNATQMAKPFEKSPKDFLKTEQTKRFMQALSEVKKILSSDLVKVVYGDNGGTWMHEDVAMEFARWLSPAFAIWCNDRIKELLTIGMTATQPTLEQMIDNPDLVIHLATQLKQEREERAKLEAQTEQQQATIKIQTEEIKKSAPKVNYYDNHLQSVNTLTSTQVAKQIGMDAEKLHRKMKEIGILYKQSGQWLLYSPFSTWGLHATRTQTYTRNDGSIGTSVYTVWTTKGLRFIHALNECGWNVKKAIKQIKGEFEPAA